MTSYHEIKTKKARIAYLKEKLSQDQLWAIKGMLRIYEFQTDQEKQIKETVESNGVGFSGCDAEILSSFSKQVLNGKTLSYNQMFRLMKKMPKYAGQLDKIAQAKN
jgi:hypothetical protein